MQNKWMQAVKGSILLHLEGDYVERFFNMCRSHDMVLWNIQREDKGFSCQIVPSDFINMAPLLRKTKTKASVIKKSGLPFYIPFMKKRILFFAGVVLCLAMLYKMTDYVWAIEYVGNTFITDDELGDFLDSEDIHYGMEKGSINCEEKEKELRARFPTVTWTSIYFEGTKLLVEIKENDKIEPVKSDVTGSDIVASENGIISAIITRNGVPKVKKGDEVEKGQTLVEGSVPVYDEAQEIVDYQIYDADADVWLETTLSYNKKIEKFYPVIFYTGVSRKNVFFEVLGHYYEISPIGKTLGSCEIVRNKKQAVILDNLYLPVYYGTVVRNEYNLQYLEYTQDEMKQILSDYYKKYILCLQEKGVHIIEKDVKIIKNEKGMELKASLDVIKSTGKKQAVQETKLKKE